MIPWSNNSNRIGSSAIALAAATGVAALLWRRLLSRSEPKKLSASRAAHRAWMKNMRAFIFDIDGVIYTGSGAVHGASEALDALRAAGKTVLFMTNNATKSREDVVATFKKHGASCRPEDVLTSSLVAAEFLKSRGLKGATVYVVGMNALSQALREQAGVVTFGGEEDREKKRSDVLEEFVKALDPPPASVAAVVVGADFNFNYYKITRAANYLRQNPSCLFVATNPDPVALLHPPHTFVPAAGSFIAAVASAAGRTPDIVCGKPSVTLARHLLEHHGLDANTTCMVGDRTDTDIEFGRSAGMHTLWVASGSMTQAEALAAEPCRRPDFFAPSIAVLRELLQS